MSRMRRDDMPVTQKELNEDVELARQAAARRLAAPPVLVGGKLKLRRKELIEMYAPECLNIHDHSGRHVKTTPGEWHPCWVERKTYREWVAKGYEPVLHNGQVVTDEDGGDVLLKCPTALYEQTLVEPRVRAAWRAKAPGEDMAGVPGAMKETMNAVSVAEAKSAAAEIG